MSVQMSARPAPVGSHVIGVQHGGIVTRDAERAKDFYMRILGPQVLPRPQLSAAGYWLGIPGRVPQVHIIQSDLPVPGPEAAINPRRRHTCFEVADYDAMKATLVREGVPYVENEQPGGRWPLLGNDPDGNTLEFQKPLA
jgi:catechol 2,3-dioxygenase-like lactoylglutathione lyase family enzyme